MTPSDLLEELMATALRTLNERATSSVNLEKVDSVCRAPSNRACVRLLMACLLAKIDCPDVDPRKPYTEIGDADSFSGRSYDEKFVAKFIQSHQLPCNSTTAFLTPALRNIDRPLTIEIELVGKPRELYVDTLMLLHEVAENRESAQGMLLDIIRILISMRNSRLDRLNQLQNELRQGSNALPLASEAIVSLIRQHMDCPHSSRLPVLVITAAYQAVANQLGEHPLPLQSHNAADQRTGSAGDVEIVLENDQRVCTVYEMKQKSVSRDDLHRAIQKISDFSKRIDNYVIITTDRIDPDVSAYAASLYDSTGGIEFVVLDCLGFLRHYLHLFHRRRVVFLDAYQTLLLQEPDSAVGGPLKEAFLALRRAAIDSPM